MVKFSRFLLGGLVGAALGVLLAPKSGRELRQSLMGGTPELPPPAPESTTEPAGAVEPDPAVNLEARLEESRRQVEDELAQAIPAEPDTEEELEEIEALDSGGDEVTPVNEADLAKTQVDKDEMRKRIEETRSRLKAKAFDSMVEGETLMATGDDSVPTGDAAEDPELDQETDEMIDELLEEED